MNETFKGLKVVELATVLAGPTVGMFLAELGAEVIKVENPTTGGDTTRKWKLKTEDQNKDHCAYFCSVNWGKQHIFVDLKQDKGQQQVRDLIHNADILLTNYRTGEAKKFGLDSDSLRKANPTLIIGNITGYGDESNRPAFDVILQAETGYMYMNGQPGQPPSKMPVALIDVLAAHQLKEGILLALLNRANTGKGSMVSVSLFDAAVSALTNQASNWLMAGHIPSQMGSLHPNIAPYGEILTTKDDTLIVLAVGNKKHFTALCSTLGVDQLVTNEKYSTEHFRIENRESLHQLLQQKAAQFTGQELLAKFSLNEVPAGEIRNMPKVFEQESAQRLIKENKLEDGTTAKRVSDIAFKIW